MKSTVLLPMPKPYPPLHAVNQRQRGGGGEAMAHQQSVRLLDTVDDGIAVYGL